MTEEDDFDDETKEKISNLEDNLEELKKEYSEENPDQLDLFICYEDLPDEDGIGVIFLNPEEYVYYYLQDFSIPQFDMNEFQSPTRQAIENFYSLGFDEYEGVELIGREYKEWDDLTEYQFKVTVSQEQAKIAKGNWVKERDLDNYVDAKTYLL
jgi:hypothetical protein